MGDLAEYFRNRDDVDEVRTNFIPIIYWDNDGCEKTYYIPLWIKYADGRIEWIENKPHRDLKPIKKYLYAHNIAGSSGNTVFRGLNGLELAYLNQ